MRNKCLLFKPPVSGLLLQLLKATETVTKPRCDSRPCFLATVSSGASPNEPDPRELMGSEATREDFQRGGCEISVQGLDGWVEFVCVGSREEERTSLKGKSLTGSLSFEDLTVG